MPSPCCWQPAPGGARARTTRSLSTHHGADTLRCWAGSKLRLCPWKEDEAPHFCTTCTGRSPRPASSVSAPRSESPVLGWGWGAGASANTYHLTRLGLPSVSSGKVPQRFRFKLGSQPLPSLPEAPRLRLNSQFWPEATAGAKASQGPPALCPGAGSLRVSGTRDAPAARHLSFRKQQIIFKEAGTTKAVCPTERRIPLWLCVGGLGQGFPPASTWQSGKPRTCAQAAGSRP